MFFACGIWCVADVSSVSPSSEQTNARNVSYTPQAKNIPYQPLLIKPVFSLLAHAEKNRFFSKLVLQCLSDLDSVVNKTCGGEELGVSAPLPGPLL